VPTWSESSVSEGARLQQCALSWPRARRSELPGTQQLVSVAENCRATHGRRAYLPAPRTLSRDQWHAINIDPRSIFLYRFVPRSRPCAHFLIPVIGNFRRRFAVRGAKPHQAQARARLEILPRGPTVRSSVNQRRGSRRDKYRHGCCNQTGDAASALCPAPLSDSMPGEARQQRHAPRRFLPRTEVGRENARLSGELLNLAS